MENLHLQMPTGPDGKVPRLVHEWIQGKLKQELDTPAIGTNSKAIDYEEIDCRADALARQLQALRVEAGLPVVLSMDDAPAMIIGLLAIFRAGAVYLPIDPACSRETVAAILRDAEPPVVLTERRLAPLFSTRSAALLYLDSPGVPSLIHPGQPVARPVGAGEPACLFYGPKPGGGFQKELLSHGAVVDYLAGSLGPGAPLEAILLSLASGACLPPASD